jgi:hypothetical protein
MQSPLQSVRMQKVALALLISVMVPSISLHRETSLESLLDTSQWKDPRGCSSLIESWHDGLPGYPAPIRLWFLNGWLATISFARQWLNVNFNAKSYDLTDGDWTIKNYAKKSSRLKTVNLSKSHNLLEAIRIALKKPPLSFRGQGLRAK